MVSARDQSPAAPAPTAFAGAAALAALIARRFPGFTPPAGFVETDRVFPALATISFVGLIQTPDQDDPIFRQLVPHPAELEPGGDPDPMAEADLTPVPGLIHRYPDRVLIMPTHRCFVHCRHCLRKSRWAADLPDARVDPERLDDLPVLARRWRDYLDARPQVKEVILSGGDPLCLPDDALDLVLAALERAGGVETIRVHSRAVVVAPGRFRHGLPRLLRRRGVGRLVTQLNHPNELGPAVAEAIRELRGAGLSVENQAVLLQGVNDQPEVLARLFTRAGRLGVKPYYLHHPDPIRGAMHFFLPLAAGWELYRKARELAPGMMPPYVVDRPGAERKTPVAELMAEPAQGCSTRDRRRPVDADEGVRYKN